MTDEYVNIDDFVRDYEYLEQDPVEFEDNFFDNIEGENDE